MKIEEWKNPGDRRYRIVSISLASAMLFVALCGVMVWNALAVSSILQIQIAPQPPFFSPQTVSAVVGAVVQWENRTREAHTIRANDCLQRLRCSFDSRMIEPGDNFVVPDLPPGEYGYHCGIHPFMRGFLTIKGKSPRVQSADI